MTNSPAAPVKLKRMRTEAWIFNGLTIFFAGIAIVYWLLAKEPVGTVALVLTGGLTMIIGTFVSFAGRRLDADRPEDRDDAEVADGAGDVGFFAPASYWPIAVAGAAAFTAVALGLWLIWLMVIGVGLLVFAVCGWLFEFQRGPAQH